MAPGTDSLTHYVSGLRVTRFHTRSFESSRVPIAGQKPGNRWPSRPILRHWVDFAPAAYRILHRKSAKKGCEICVIRKWLGLGWPTLLMPGSMISGRISCHHRLLNELTDTRGKSIWRLPVMILMKLKKLVFKLAHS